MLKGYHSWNYLESVRIKDNKSCVKFKDSNSKPPILEAWISSEQTARKTFCNAWASHGSVTGRIPVATVFPNSSDPVQMAAARTEAVGHDERHFPDARSDAWIGHSVRTIGYTPRLHESSWKHRKGMFISDEFIFKDKIFNVLSEYSICSLDQLLAGAKRPSCKWFVPLAHSNHNPSWPVIYQLINWYMSPLLLLLLIILLFKHFHLYFPYIRVIWIIS